MGSRPSTTSTRRSPNGPTPSSSRTRTRSTSPSRWPRRERVPPVHREADLARPRTALPELDRRDRGARTSSAWSRTSCASTRASGSSRSCSRTACSGRRSPRTPSSARACPAGIPTRTTGGSTSRGATRAAASCSRRSTTSTSSMRCSGCRGRVFALGGKLSRLELDVEDTAERAARLRDPGSPPPGPGPASEGAPLRGHRRGRHGDVGPGRARRSSSAGPTAARTSPRSPGSSGTSSSSTSSGTSSRASRATSGRSSTRARAPRA